MRLKRASPAPNAPRTGSHSRKSVRPSTASSACSYAPQAKTSAAWKAKAVVVLQWVMPTRLAKSAMNMKAKAISYAMARW
ncbi:hypothetical protein D3C81_1023610 [compost metagenome]